MNDRPLMQKTESTTYTTMDETDIHPNDPDLSLFQGRRYKNVRPCTTRQNVHRDRKDTLLLFPVLHVR
jgi:hypothetical protein